MGKTERFLPVKSQHTLDYLKEKVDLEYQNHYLLFIHVNYQHKNMDVVKSKGLIILKIHLRTLKF